MTWIFLPEFFLVGCVAAYISLALYSRGKNSVLDKFSLLLNLDYVYWSLAFSLVVSYVLLTFFRYVNFGINSFLNIYLFSVGILVPYFLIFQVLLGIVSFLFFFVISFNMISLVGNFWNKLEANFFMLFIIFSVGLLFLLDNFILIFILIEIYNVCIITLLVLNLEKSVRSLEGALRYFVFSAFSSVLLLLGVSYLYWILGTFSLNNYKAYFAVDHFLFLFKNHVFLLAGIFLILVALFVKMGLAPLHNWLIEIYEGAPYIILFWLLNIVKLGFFIFFVSFYSIFHSIVFLLWPPVLWVGLNSLLVGCFGAIYQLKLKTLVGFSSILNFGFLTVFVVLSSNFNVMLWLVFFYLVIYLASMFGVFVIFFIMSGQAEINRVEDLVSLRFYEGGVVARLLTLILVGLAGFPPLGLFYSKFFIVVSLGLQSIFTFVVAIIIFVISLVGTYYYLRLVKLVWYTGSMRVLFFRSIQNIEIATLSVVFWSISVFVCLYLYLGL